MKRYRKINLNTRSNCISFHQLTKLFPGPMVHMLSRFSKSDYYHQIYSVSVNCTSLVGKTEGLYLWRELQKACQQVQPPSMGHPNNNIRYPAVSCHFQQLVEKAHHAFCSFSSVSLHCGKLGGQKVVKLLWNTMSDTIVTGELTTWVKVKHI